MKRIDKGPTPKVCNNELLGASLRCVHSPQLAVSGVVQWRRMELERMLIVQVSY